VDADDYIRGDGEWVPVHPASTLGAALVAVRRTARPPPPAPPPPVMPDVPLAVCVCGGPASGRSTVAKALSVERFLTLLEPSALVQAAVRYDL
jgi:hypothetical protein